MEEESSIAAAAVRHIKKRALRNSALSVTFDDKRLRDYVTGFHKRKKKRRKEAQRRLQEKDRLKRLEERKKRKLERELALYGRAAMRENPSGSGSADEHESDLEENDGFEPKASVSGTKTYDNGDTAIMVTTSEISREDEDLKVKPFTPKLSGEEKMQHNLPVKKKPFKGVAKQRSQKKPRKSSQKKGNKKKGSKGKNKR